MKHILVSTVILMFLGLIEPLSAQPEQAPAYPASPTLPVGVSSPSIVSTPAALAPSSFQDTRVAVPGDWRTQDGVFGIAVAGQDISRRSPFDIAMEAYRNAESDEDRNAAKTEIQKELDTQYDDFIDQQGKQVEELESRLAKLKEQLQKRREAKGRMVELKLQMVISQAEGLGWPETHQRGNAFSSATPPPQSGQAFRGDRIDPGFPIQPVPPGADVPERARAPRQPTETRAPRGGR